MTEHNLIAKMINISNIQVKDRRRATDRGAVLGMANSIAEDGLLTPILVAQRSRGNGYKLVEGAHRIAAFEHLNMSEIPCFVVKGNAQKLAYLEIIANISRKELIMIDRARFTHKLRLLWEEKNPDILAAHGGNRRSDNFHDTTVVFWSKPIATDTGWTERTLQRADAIGGKLSEEVYQILVKTPISDNQKELEQFVKSGPDIQLAIANTLAAGDKTTVKSALAHVSGVKEAPKPPKTGNTKLSALIELWDAANAKTKDAFLAHIEEVD